MRRYCREGVDVNYGEGVKVWVYGFYLVYKKHVNKGFSPSGFNSRPDQATGSWVN